jgi:hypothetical protein
MTNARQQAITARTSAIITSHPTPLLEQPEAVQAVDSVVGPSFDDHSG